MQNVFTYCGKLLPNYENAFLNVVASPPTPQYIVACQVLPMSNKANVFKVTDVCILVARDRGGDNYRFLKSTYGLKFLVQAFVCGLGEVVFAEDPTSLAATVYSIWKKLN